MSNAVLDVGNIRVISDRTFRRARAKATCRVVHEGYEWVGVGSSVYLRKIKSTRRRAA